MRYFKARIFAFVLIVVSIGLIYINWHQLLQQGRYSMKLAAFGPVVGIGGIYLLIFPSRAGKPTTTKEKIIVLIVFGIGLAVGLINWYLIDPGFFGEETDLTDVLSLREKAAPHSFELQPEEVLI